MKLEELIHNPRLVLQLIAAFTSIAVLVTDLEWLYLHKHFKNNGLFSWVVRRYRVKTFFSGVVVNLSDQVFKYPNIIYFFLLRVVLAIVLIFLWNTAILAYLCLAIVVTSSMLSIRGNEGTTGAESMSILSLGAVGLTLLSSTGHLYQFGILFIALQLILSYSTSGWMRILQPTWRDGTDLLSVLRQHTYGNRTVWLILSKTKPLTAFISTSVLVFECSSIIVPLLPMPFVVIFIVSGFIFHLVNAIVIGLNSFFWAFVPTYLAYYWVAVFINNLIYN
jgi:hypothetical protein